MKGTYSTLCFKTKRQALKAQKDIQSYFEDQLFYSEILVGIDERGNKGFYVKYNLGEMITKEEVLKNFPDAERIRFGTFFDLPICLFDSNYFEIEIRTIDEGFLVNMHKFNSMDAISEIVKSKEAAISFINGVFLNGL